MSDVINRYEDKRMDKLEKTIDDIKEDLGEVKQKIFNGFSHSIKSTEDKVNYIDQHNTIEHKELKESLKDLSKKFDKMLWLWASGSISIVVGVIIVLIKGAL